MRSNNGLIIIVVVKLNAIFSLGSSRIIIAAVRASLKVHCPRIIFIFLIDEFGSVAKKYKSLAFKKARLFRTP